MSSRTKAIGEFIRAAYMQPEQLDTMVEVFSKQAALLGKKFKSPEGLDVAKKTVRSDEFIKQFAPSFDELSIEELNSLASFFNSDMMKRYNKANSELTPFFKAVQESFLERQ